MRTKQQPNGRLTDEERQDPKIAELLQLFADVDIIETLYADAYRLRDEQFTTLVEEAGTRGPGRGLSVRLGNELGVTDAAVKSMKGKTRRRRTEGELVTGVKARAALAALQAAGNAYRAVMAEEEGDGGGSA
jgi:hypothetical protein